MCDQCAKEATAAGRKKPAPRPCKNCGSLEPKPRGRHTCQECTDLIAEASKVKRSARSVVKRKPCRGCGRPKQTGNGRSLCDRCKAERTQTVRCSRCRERPIRGPRKNLCQQCADAASRDRRAYMRRRARKYRLDMHLAGQTVKRAKSPDRDNSRLRYRLEVMQGGREVAESDAIRDAKGSRVDSVSFPDLPAGPMADAISRLIEREAVGAFGAFAWDSYDESGDVIPTHQASRGPEVPSVRATICSRLGISEKAHYEWREGKRRSVMFDVADKILARSGWCWWDIWQRCRADCSTVLGPQCHACHGHEMAERAFESTDISHVA